MPFVDQHYSSSRTLRAVGSHLHNSAGGMVLKGFANPVVSTCEVTLDTNEKLNMQNLNTRLASYLEKVHSLEAVNKKIELQIKEFYESRSPIYRKDLTLYYSTIEDLHKQILTRSKENAQLLLQLDGVSLTSADLKMKFEWEMGLRLAAEADVAGLRKSLGNLQLAHKALELQIPGLQEELAYLKKNHEEELYLLRAQHGGSVNVEIDCGPSMNLEMVLQEMREQYESLIQKNHSEAEHWFQSKTKTLKSEVTSSCTEIKTSQTELAELKRTSQKLQTEMNKFLMQKQALEGNLDDVGMRYSTQLTQLQLFIDQLQEELKQLNASMQQQATEYQILLDIKMRLELEIAEYRRLLEGDGGGSVMTSSTKTTVTETVTEKVEIEETVIEEYNPHLQRRVKVIVEELVDGKVVSTSVDEKIQDVK